MIQLIHPKIVNKNGLVQVKQIMRHFGLDKIM